jgi:hypothetical protein
MKLFECQDCGQPLLFENTRCEGCGTRLGYLPGEETVSALRQDGESWLALAKPDVCYRFCANAAHGVCNWLIPAHSTEQFCLACRHNRIIPDLSLAENLRRWRLIELAKHRLFYTLIKLRLPLEATHDGAKRLAFEFVERAGDAAEGPRAMTGHANGLITINLAEADDAERERRRAQLGELYRTLLGHFRHEIAHYYWDRLIANSPRLADFRRSFGDERCDYTQALKTHYAQGAPADWRDQFISGYASAHPWEDFAETWAHYFHMVDTLETAGAFGLAVKPKPSQGMAARIDFDPALASLERIIEAWLPLTFAVNSINRSMGVPDLYPFVLSPRVMGKLAYVHDCIPSTADAMPRPAGAS